MGLSQIQSHNVWEFHLLFKHDQGFVEPQKSRSQEFLRQKKLLIEGVVEITQLWYWLIASYGRFLVVKISFSTVRKHFSFGGTVGPFYSTQEIHATKANASDLLNEKIQWHHIKNENIIFFSFESHLRQREFYLANGFLYFTIDDVFVA